MIFTSIFGITIIFEGKDVMQNEVMHFVIDKCKHSCSCKGVWGYLLLKLILSLLHFWTKLKETTQTN